MTQIVSNVRTGGEGGGSSRSQIKVRSQVQILWNFWQSSLGVDVEVADSAQRLSLCFLVGDSLPLHFFSSYNVCLLCSFSTLVYCIFCQSTVLHPPVPLPLQPISPKKHLTKRHFKQIWLLKFLFHAIITC